MTPQIQKILSGKRERRKQLAALPFVQKLALLEKLRDRSMLIASSPLRKLAFTASRNADTPVGPGVRQGK